MPEIIREVGSFTGHENKKSVQTDTGGIFNKQPDIQENMESWLLFSFPDKAMEIARSQGHTELTQLRHYANLPFLDKDREEMKEFVVGWA
jgi:hypothetical protein